MIKYVGDLNYSINDSGKLIVTFEESGLPSNSMIEYELHARVAMSFKNNKGQKNQFLTEPYSSFKNFKSNKHGVVKGTIELKHSVTETTSIKIDKLSFFPIRLKDITNSVVVASSEPVEKEFNKPVEKEFNDNRLF